MRTVNSKRRDYHPDSAPRVHPRFTTLSMDVRDGALRSCIGRARIVPSDFTDSDLVMPGSGASWYTCTMPLTEHERALFALARKLIANGSLPRTVPGSVWAGSGTGATCSLCELTIEPEQVEYELAGDGGATFHFHIRCHALWQLAASHSLKGA
jgi:hypothetical protein